MSAAVAATTAGHTSLGWPDAGAAGQPFGVLDAACLLEQVDYRVAVAAQGERAARGGQCLGRGQAVAQVTLGGGAQAGERLASAE